MGVHHEVCPASNLFAGLSTVAWAKCQQDSKCEGVCHPVAPDNSKEWYSTTNCRSGCKCWRKRECDIQHKKMQHPEWNSGMCVWKAALVQQPPSCVCLR